MIADIIDLHFKALTYAYPIFNFLILLMTIFGAVRSRRFRPAFLTLAVASVLLLIPQTLQAILDVQKDLGQQFLPKPFLRLFIPYAFASNWLALPVDILGVWLFVRQAIKSNERSA